MCDTYYLAEESIVTVGKRFTRYLLIFFSELLEIFCASVVS